MDDEMLHSRRIYRPGIVINAKPIASWLALGVLQIIEISLPCAHKDVKYFWLQCSHRSTLSQIGFHVKSGSDLHVILIAFTTCFWAHLFFSESQLSIQSNLLARSNGKSHFKPTVVDDTEFISNRPQNMPCSHERLIRELHLSTYKEIRKIHHQSKSIPEVNSTPHDWSWLLE